jgi:hypothetical protein
VTATATDIFDFINLNRTWVVERHEIASLPFGNLRRSLRSIFMRLHESDDQESCDLSDKLRMFMSEWLTVPLPFDSVILEAVQTIGGITAVHARWGGEVGASYEAALQAAKDLSLCENPVRSDLRNVIGDLRTQNRSFKIYCHRRARPHFDSLFGAEHMPLDRSAFLHSIRDYRDTAPFNTLIKVGPLRSHGWGSAPDALVTAPRFGKLVQIVWSGCGDEPDFGYDPVALPPETSATSAAPANASTKGSDGAQTNRISWVSRVTHIGEDSGGMTGDFGGADEFQLFTELRQPRDQRLATLIQIDDEQGILYPKYAQVLSFDPAPNAIEPLGLRCFGTDLVEGMFAILPRLGEVDFGGLHAGEGQFSSTWKERLRDELRINPNAICHLLQNNGVRLLHLRSCMENWAKPPTTVIHAPQSSSDFEILIKILGVDFDPSDPRARGGIPWWQYAWREIRRARGEAIQMGLHEQEKINDKLRVVLDGLLPEIRDKAATNINFQLPIAAGKDVCGDFLFFKVLFVEEGFLAPDTELKCVRELNAIEQWRV